MVVVGSAASRNEKEVKTVYPVVTGLVAGTTDQRGRVHNLVFEKSLVSHRKKVGL